MNFGSIQVRLLGHAQTNINLTLTFTLKYRNERNLIFGELKFMMMKRFQNLMILIFILGTQFGYAQVSQKTYEITVTITDQDGNTEVNELVIEGEEMSQEELDALIQKQLDAYDKEEVDININVNVSEIGGAKTDDGETKKITKIIKKRNNLSEEEKIIIEEHDMEIEVKGDKVYINGEEVKDGDFGDKKIRIMKFEEGEEFDLERILEGEDIEIGEGEKIFFIEREESSEGLAFLGVTTKVPSENGLPIGSIVKGSSAEKIGLQVDDVIMSIEGKKISDFESLSKVIKSYLPGEAVKLTYMRDGIANVVDIELSDYDKYSNRNTWVEEDFMRGGHGRKRHHFKRERIDDDSPSLGVILQGAHKDAIIIDEVLAGSAAEKAGIQAGDIITSIGKAEMLSLDQTISTIKAHEIGGEVKVKVLRDGKKLTLRPVLEKLPRRDGLQENTSTRVERIIIKERKEDDARSDFETSGAIKLTDFDLSPNPSEGEINVKFGMDASKADDEVTVRIIALDGKIVEEKVLEKFDGRFNNTYDLSDHPSGVYLFQAEKNGQKFTKRFVLKQK